MRRLSFGVLLIALSTLMLELMLTRVFDVVLVPNLAYFVVTAAVFAFGLAGGPTRPSAEFNQSSFWAVGINFGMKFSY